MTPSQRDRIMSLHRRAYQCETLDQWWALARKLECPIEAIDQFWRTAQTAKNAGMSKEKAFPLSGEVFKVLDRDCLPGDLVWWRTVAGEISEGELKEWDSNVAVVENRTGRHAVEC